MFEFFNNKNSNKISLNNLFVVAVGYENNGKFCPKNEYLIVKYKKGKYNHPTYEDIFTNQVYYLAFDYNVNDLEQCVASPRTITSLLNSGPYKEKLLSNGYISKQELIALYELLNPIKDKIDELKPSRHTNPNKAKIKVKRRGNIIEFPNKKQD